MSRLWSLCAISMFSFKALATPSIDVITVEYPPFASRAMQNEGLVFELLRDHYPLPQGWSYSSYFVPPARAQHMVENESWCVSLYPPLKPSEYVKFVPLGGEEVKLGFAVHINSVTNKWKSAANLEGKMVALLRTKTPSEAQLMFEAKKADILYVEQVEQGVEMLYRHRVDLAFVDHITFKQLRKEHEDWHDIEFSDDILRAVPVGVFYNSQCPHRVMLNKVFKLAPI